MGVSNITTADDLFAVLDAIAAKTTYDTYSSLRLYYNQIHKTSVIYSTEEDGTENVVAVLSLDSMTVESKVYVTRILKSSTIVSEGTNVFDVALGGFLGVDLLIKNISRSLGVIIEDNFKEDNEVLYNELVSIIANYYGDDVYKYPYIMRKHAEESYLSYIPVNLIIEFAIYFNKINLFTKLEKVNVYQPIIKFGIPVNQFANFMSFDEFKEFLTDFKVAQSNWFNNQTELDERRESWYPKLSGRLESLYNKLDPNNLLIALISGNRLIGILELPNDIIFIPYNTTYTSSWVNSGGNNPDYGDHLDSWSFKITKESVITLHQFLTGVGGTIHITKNVFEASDLDKIYKCSEFAPYTGTSREFIVNIKQTKYLSSYIYYSQREQYYLKYIAKLQPNKDYSFSDLSKLSMDDLYYLIPYNEFIINIKSLLDNYSVEVTNNDFIQVAIVHGYYNYNPYKIKVLVIKNLDNFRFTVTSNTDNSVLAVDSFALPTNITSYVQYQYRTSFGFTNPTNRYGLTDWYDTYGLARQGGKLLLNESIEYTIYTYDLLSNEMSKEEFTGNDILLYDKELDTTTYPETATLYNIMNLGMLVDNVDYKDEALIGISLEENATYPTHVLDETSLNNTYPDWSGYLSVAPQIVDGIVDSTVTTRWKPLSVTPNGLVQETSQAGNIDTTNITNIVNSIDAAVDDDTDEPDDTTKPEIDPTVDPDVNPNDDKPSTNVGDTPDIPLDASLPKLLESGVVHQYKMSLEQLKNFSDKCLSADILSSIAKLFVNPVDAVISLQAAYMYNAVGAVDGNVKFNGRAWEDVTGLRLDSNYVSESLGTITLEPYFNNYTDYTDTEIDLYLPFVGFVQLNVADFIDGDIKIDYRIDTLTGIIVYSIYSVKDEHTQLLHLFDGNCQQVMPLSSADFSRLYGAIFGVATAGITAVTGMNPIAIGKELID